MCVCVLFCFFICGKCGVSLEYCGGKGSNPEVGSKYDPECRKDHGP